jgi:hypothetical protein
MGAYPDKLVAGFAVLLASIVWTGLAARVANNWLAQR